MAPGGVRQAIDRLREGNRRFVAGVRAAASAPRAFSAQTASQAPFAAVLACSDSRVPVEMVFDQDVGDLFVVRVAGNIAGPSQIGSVEFAADRLGTRLVVVLGHTRCGAVEATLDAIQRPAPLPSPHLAAIIRRIRRGVEPALASGPPSDRAACLSQAVRANVRATVVRLREGSAILGRLAASDGLAIVGAEYALETGAVEFFDGVPATARRTGRGSPLS